MGNWRATRGEACSGGKPDRATPTRTTPNLENARAPACRGPRRAEGFGVVRAPASWGLRRAERAPNVAASARAFRPRPNADRATPTAPRKAPEISGSSREARLRQAGPPRGAGKGDARHARKVEREAFHRRSLGETSGKGPSGTRLATPRVHENALPGLQGARAASDRNRCGGMLDDLLVSLSPWRHQRAAEMLRPRIDLLLRKRLLLADLHEQRLRPVTRPEPGSRRSAARSGE